MKAAENAGGAPARGGHNMGGNDELFKTNAQAMLQRMPWPDGGLTASEMDAHAAVATLPWRGRVDRAQRERGGVISQHGQYCMRRDRHPTPSHISLRSL